MTRPTTRADRAARKGQASGQRAGQHRLDTPEKRLRENFLRTIAFHQCKDYDHKTCGGIGELHVCVAHQGWHSSEAISNMVEALERDEDWASPYAEDGHDLFVRLNDREAVEGRP